MRWFRLKPKCNHCWVALSYNHVYVLDRFYEHTSHTKLNLYCYYCGDVTEKFVGPSELSAEAVAQFAQDVYPRPDGKRFELPMTKGEYR